MLHTKFCGNLSASSGEDFKGFYHIWAWRPAWSCDQHHVIRFLAHLSRRLIGELIGYPWSGVRPSSVVNNFKQLLLQNRWADQSQILCGAFLGRGNDILFGACRSHDQDGRHAHIW